MRGIFRNVRTVPMPTQGDAKLEGNGEWSIRAQHARACVRVSHITTSSYDQVLISDRHLISAHTSAGVSLAIQLIHAVIFFRVQNRLVVCRTVLFALFVLVYHQASCQFTTRILHPLSLQPVQLPVCPCPNLMQFFPQP